MDSRSPAGGPADEMILDSLVEHVVRHDREMRIIWANRAACESVGLSRQEVIGRHCYELWACREDPCPDCPVIAAMRDGERHRIERNTPDGRAWLITGSPVRDEEGAIIGGVEITLEITDRKRAEETLQASENRQRFVVAHMPVLMSAVDADGNIVEWNHECERVTGYTAEEIVGNPRAMELLYPDADYRRQLMAEWKKQGSEFRDWEHRLRCKNGSERIIALSSIAERPSTADWVSWSIGVDVTERKRAEEASRESRALLEATIESLPFDFFALDTQGRYILQNSFCRRRWGDSIGQRPEELDIDEEIRSLWLANNRRALAGETIDEEAAFSFGGRSGFYRNIITPIRDEGEIRGILGVNLDVTARKQIEEERLAHLRFFESLERIDQAIRRAADLEEMMSAVLEATRAVFDCDRAWLLYPCDPEASSWRVPMERTTPEYPGALALDAEVPMDEGVAGVLRLVLATDGPVKFGHGSEHPLPEASARQFNYLSQMSMAVHPRTGVPWMFGLHQCSYPREWSDQEERLFQEIGRRIADSLSTLLMLRDLRESRRALATLMDNLPGMAYRCLNDEHWTMRFVSDGCVELTGYQSEELIDNAAVAYADLIHPDDRQMVREEIEEALAARDLFQIIYRIRTAQGRQRWVWEQGRGVFDDDGHLEALEGFIADITERQEAEAALIASEQNYRAIFDATNDAFFIHDAQTGKILDVNQKMCDLFGYEREEVRNRTVAQLSADRPPYTDEEALRWIRRAAEEGPQSYEWLSRRKDGETFWAEVNLKSTFIGGEQRVIAVGRDITERKRAEDALRESEERYRGLFNTMAQGAVYQNEDGQIISANAAAERILGLSLHEMTGRVSADPRWRAIREDGSDFVGETHPAMVALRTGEPVRDVLMGVFNPRQERYRWIIIDAVPEIRPGEDRPFRVYTTFTDITERREAEKALQESRQMLQLVLDSIPVRVFWKDRQSVYLGCNRHFARDAGLASPADVPGRNDFELTWREQAQLYRTDDAEVISSGTPKLNYEEPQTWPDGTSLWLRTSKIPLRDLEGGIVGVLGCYEDITARKRAEEALRKSEEQLRFMVEQMPAVVWTVDADLRFTSSQGGGLHELRLFPDQVIGQNLLQYFHTDDLQFPPIVAHRRALDGESVEYEMTWTGRTFATHVEPLRDPDSRIIGCVGVALDITERKAAEEEVRRRAEAERLLLSELDHRVRNNLSSLIALIDLMGASSTDVGEFAQAIRGRAQTMATVHGVLSRSHWEAVRLRALLDALVPPGVRGTLRITGSDLRITAAQAQSLGMVINELMTNSLKHGALGAAGGVVDVSWEEAPASTDGIALTLHWEESGGPAIKTTPEPGFGTGLINGLVNSELRGRARFDYSRGGARHLFRFNLDEPKTPLAPAGADPATDPESG